MKVKELIEILESLNQDQEIRYESYEFLGDYKIDNVISKEYNGKTYYCIEGD